MALTNPVVKATVVVTLAATLIAGCQTTTDPYTGEKKTTSTTLGALIGAGAGAAIGMISGHDAKQRRQRALVGAGVGAHFNRQLSQRRASAVAQYLMSKGVSEQRIITAAGGEDHPIASNSTDQGRAANRRVEVTLAPLKEG